MAKGDISVKVALEGYETSLYALASVMDVTAQYLRFSEPPREAVVEYGQRTWADLHLEALGWSLFAAVSFLALYLAWLAR